MQFVTARVLGSALVMVVSYGCSSADPVAPPVDASTTDTKMPGVDSSIDRQAADVVEEDSGGCMPGDVSAFTPPPYTPPALKKGACTLANISDFDADCFAKSTSSPPKCSAFETANPGCVACLQTPDSAASWGPLIEHLAQKTVSLNLGGCAQIAGSMACGKSYEADQACEAAACNPSCPVVANDNDVSINALNDCYTASNSAGCKSYRDTAAACENDDGGPITTMCFGGATFDATFIAVAPLFCGP